MAEEEAKEARQSNAILVERVDKMEHNFQIVVTTLKDELQQMRRLLQSNVQQNIQFNPDYDLSHSGYGYGYRHEGGYGGGHGGGYRHEDGYEGGHGGGYRNKDGYEWLDLTRNILIKTAVGYILKTEQPISYICHDHLPLIDHNFPLRVRTIS